MLTRNSQFSAQNLKILAGKQGFETYFAVRLWMGSKEALCLSAITFFSGRLDLSHNNKHEIMNVL